MKKPKIPFTYQGSKLGELNKLKDFIPIGSKIIEPFLGTGIVSYKYGKRGSCIGNDLNLDLYNIWIHATDPKFIAFSKSLMNEDNRYKQFYYDHRKQFNEKYFRSKELNAERAALFYYLINSSHAGMVRYGPNGFNVSFKLFLINGRKYQADARLKLLSEVYSTFSEFYNFSAIDFLKSLEHKLNSFDVIYCDPPYTSTHLDSAHTYVDQWSDQDLIELDDFLDYAFRKYSIRAVMSNYLNENITLKGRVVSSFDRTRMASTKLTMSKNVIFEYGPEAK